MKPYIVVHMMMSVDGRIDCPMVAQISGDEYYDALDRLGKCSKLSGRVTTVLECTAVKGEFPEGNTANPINREAYNMARKSEEYSIVVDTRGKIDWKDAEADGFPLITIVSEDVSKDYLDELTSQGISWISAGKGRIDLRRAVEILNEKFGIGKIAVVGGGNICGGFTEAGLIDEVSMMIAPGIDGRKGGTSVFDGIISDGTPYKLKLKSIEKLDNEVIWIRYDFLG